MAITALLLGLATLLCALVAGLVFTFGIIVMPGIGTLPDHDFLQAFKVMDRIIQANHPLFVGVWLGSIIALIAATAFGFGQLAGLDRSLLVLACAVYLLGVQLPTVAINVPLNNALQEQDLSTLDDAARHAVREAFEPRWVFWNGLRTICAVLVVGLLLWVLWRG